MGHKVNPVGLRVGINRTWDSRWYASRGEYGRLLHEDMAIRDHILKQRRAGGIAKVVIERPHKKCRVTVHTARPGVLIGKKGADIEKMRSELAKLTESEVHLNIVEVRKPEIDATLVAETIAQQLERRVAFRRAMKRSVQSALRLGALGIRINCSGRLGGASARPKRRAPLGFGERVRDPLRGPSVPERGAWLRDARFALRQRRFQVGTQARELGEPVRALTDRDRPLGVRAQRQARHAQERGLLLQPARVRQDARGGIGQADAVEVADRLDQLHGRGRREGLEQAEVG